MVLSLSDNIVSVVFGAVLVIELDGNKEFFGLEDFDTCFELTIILDKKLVFLKRTHFPLGDFVGRSSIQ